MAKTGPSGTKVLEDLAGHRFETACVHEQQGIGRVLVAECDGVGDACLRRAPDGRRRAARTIASTRGASPTNNAFTSSGRVTSASRNASIDWLAPVELARVDEPESGTQVDRLDRVGVVVAVRQDMTATGEPGVVGDDVVEDESIDGACRSGLPERPCLEPPMRRLVGGRHVGHHGRWRTAGRGSRRAKACRSAGRGRPPLRDRWREDGSTGGHRSVHRRGGAGRRRSPSGSRVRTGRGRTASG